jgi:hypothetical protein
MFKLYVVPSYSLPASKFESHSDIFNLEDAKEQLSADACFHFRVHPATHYIFFGDLDNYTKDIEPFIELLYDFMVARYGLEFDKERDFKYTKNTAKAGSYHYSIPKWNLLTEKLKEIHNELIKFYPDEFVVRSGERETYCVDTTIYSEHWFRCPNQSKGDNKSKGVHSIIYGELEDFIIDYIPSDSINIDNIQLLNINTNTASALAPTLTTTNEIITTTPATTTHDAVQLPPNPVPAPVPIPQLPIQNAQNDVNLLSYSISKIDIYKKLFDECFLPTRFSAYDNWIKVGMAIKNTISNQEDAIAIFQYFSSKATNYDGDEATTRKYNSFKISTTGYGVGTIYKMALEDNKQNAVRILGAAKLQLLTQDYCRFIKALAGNKYFYKVDNNTIYKLYCYNGRYWENNIVKLREFIGQELYEFLKNLLTEVYWHSLGRDFQSYKDKLDRLNNFKFKNEIIDTYKEFNSREDIEFDNKWWLFGFNDVVYDMNTCTFRDYEYDDYITITANYKWREPTEAEMTRMWDFIKCIMPVDDEREAFLTILATGIDGRCTEKFIIFNGSGGNGKGVINDIMLAMLGSYGMIGNNGMLFEPSKMGSNPEKANLHRKRYVVFREPPAKKKFENSIIKELTGGGKISARGHYESETQKYLCNTMICECNDKPKFSEEITKADSRRIIDIYFKCSFTDDERYVDHEHFIYKANPYFKTQEFIDQHKFALFKILTTYHKKFMIEQCSTLKMPASIVKRTEAYLENNCDIVSWFQFNYKKDESGSSVSYTRLCDIYDNFVISSDYQCLTRAEQKTYCKTKFFQFIKTNIFFRKYYIENHDSLRYWIKGWSLDNEISL